MKSERWALAVIMVGLMLLSVGAASAQESEPSTEPESAEAPETEAEAETAVDVESAAETQPAPDTAGADFSATVEFSQLQKTELEGSAGGIDVLSVEFEVAGAKGGGIAGAFSSADAEMQAVITTRLSLKNTADTKVKFDVMVEFLDKDGQVVDRAMNSDNFKKNQRTFDFKHTTLRWAVDHINQARITVKQKE
jgi:hypothetical protein